MKKCDFQKACRDDPTLYRDPLNYAEDLLAEDVSSTGIKEPVYGMILKSSTAQQKFPQIACMTSWNQPQAWS